MWRLLCRGQQSCPVLRAWTLLQQRPAACAGTGSYVTPQQAQCWDTCVQFSQQHALSHSAFVHITVGQSHNSSSSSSTRASYGTVSATGSNSTTPGLDPAAAAQPASPADVSNVSSAASQHPASSSGNGQQDASVVVKTGFVTLPPHATASGYCESFTATTQQRASSSYLGPMQEASSSSTSTSSRTTNAVASQPIWKEQLRIKLREEAQDEAPNEDVDIFSLSRSTGSDGHSFDTPSAAINTSTEADQPAKLSVADRQLLEKLVGVMTKDGRKSRARRCLLDAMHIIKKQVASSQQ